MIVVGTLHPAFILRSGEGDQGEARFKHVVIDDVKKALRFRSRSPQWDESVIWDQDVSGRYVNLFPTVDDVRHFVANARGQNVACDIECTGNDVLTARLICIGFATASGDALCFPILKRGGQNYWSDEDWAVVRPLIVGLLADVSTPKVFHNGGFDTIALWAAGFPVAGWMHDTMLAHHAVDAEMPHSLAFLGSVYLEHPYWKDDVKGGEAWLDIDDTILRSYNLRDCLVTIRCLPHLLREMQQWGLLELYSNSIQLAQILCRATIRGVEVDVTRRYWLYRELKRQRERALGELRKLSGKDDFNPSSTTQLREFLFTTLKFPKLRFTESVDPTTGENNPSTDKKTMALLALHADTPEQKRGILALVRFRKVDKLIGTYTGNFGEGATDKPGIRMLRHGSGRDATYRVHATWKQLTVTGRLSSSPNMQNLMPLVKAMFRAGKGNKIVAVDLSQAELRVMSYAADDKELQRAYTDGLNLHTVNTVLIFGIRPPDDETDINPQTIEYLREACPRLRGEEWDSLPRAPTVEIWTDTRRLSKEVVFGDNYNASAETLYETSKAKRDRKTDEPLFPNLTLGEIEAAKIQWETLHPPIVKYWKRVDVHARRTGYLRSPWSGRLKRFRAGFKITETVNWLIQEAVSAHMNAATLRIAARLYVETNDAAQIIIQVHDALYIEAPDEYVDVVKAVLKEELSKTRPLQFFPDGPNFPAAYLPPDKAKVARYLDAV